MKAIRIYRTVSSDTGIDFRKIAEIPLAGVTDTYTDTLPAVQAANAPVLESFTWNPPPRRLNGVLSIGGGALAGFEGKNVYFSVPYRPHAWPQELQIAVGNDIVALGTYSGNLVITTTGRTVQAIGASPESMAVVTSELIRPNVSASGLASLPGAVIFPSTDGLVMVSANGEQVISAPWMTKQEWTDQFSPSTIKAAAHKGKYVGFFNDSNGISLDMSDLQRGFTTVHKNDVLAFAQDSVTGNALVVADGAVSEWDDGDEALPYLWASKPILAIKPINFAAIQVRADYRAIPPSLPELPVLTTYSSPLVGAGVMGVGAINGGAVPSLSERAKRGVYVKLFGDGVLRWSGLFSSEAPVRLPSGYKAVQWSFEVISTLSVFSIAIATTKKSLETTE